MKILFLAHRIPYPPDKGDKIRAYQVLKFLARQHQIYLACLIDNPRDLAAVPELRRMVHGLSYQVLSPFKQRLAMLRALISMKPLTVAYFFVHAFHRQVEALVRREQFDALFVYSSNMAGYVRDMPIPLRLIDYCDVDSEKFKQFGRLCRGPAAWLYRWEGERLAAYERSAAENFQWVFLINQEEQRLFEASRARHKIALMSNGVDFTYYATPGTEELPAEVQHGKPYVIFTGAMNYLPNVDAAHRLATEIFPLLKTRMPELQLYLVGSNPVCKIRRLHAPRAGIIVTGYVNDIRPYVKRARVFVGPMRIARGMQTKILEAMACGVPVVTSAAAGRGIGAKPEQEILAAHTPVEYAQQTWRLLVNDHEHRRLRQQAAQFLRENFSWERNLEILNQILTTKPVVHGEEPAGHNA